DQVRGEQSHLERTWVSLMMRRQSSKDQQMPSRGKHSRQISAYPACNAIDCFEGTRTAARFCELSRPIIVLRAKCDIASQPVDFHNLRAPAHNVYRMETFSPR